MRLKHKHLSPFFILISLAIIFIQITNADNGESEPSPTIKVIDIVGETEGKHQWETLDLENNATNLIARHKEPLVLDLVCTAPYEIYWQTDYLNFHANEDHEERECADFPQMRNETLIYTNTLSIHYSPNITSLLSRKTCAKLYSGDKQTKTTINIFVPDTKGTLFKRGTNLTYFEDDKWLPCRVSDPRIQVSLFAENPQTGVQEKINSKYDPAQGFLLNGKINTTIICSVGDEKVRFEPQLLLKENDPLPQLQLMDFAIDKPWQKDWQTIDLQNGDINVIAKSNNEKILHIVCTGPKDVRWSYWYELDRNVNHIRDCDSFAKSNNGKLVYSRSLSIRFATTTKLQVSIGCLYEAGGWSGPTSRINVFFPDEGNTPLVHSGTTQYYTENDEADEAYLKCPTTNPKIPVTLWSEDPETEETTKITNVTYNPRIGFKLKERHGNYICSTSEHDIVRFHRWGDPEPARDIFDYIIYVIKLKDIIFHCNHTKYNSVFIPNSIDITANATTDLWLDKDTTTLTEVQVIETENFYPTAKIFCMQKDKKANGIQRGKVLSKWKVGSISKNLSHPVYPSEESFHFKLKNRKPEGHVEWYQYEVDHILFISSEGGYTMYLNDTSTFTCETGMTENNLTFWMEFLDGNRLELNQDLDATLEVKVEANNKATKLKIWKLRIRLPINAVAIICEIPYLKLNNTVLYLGAERRFRTAYLSPPTIFKPEKDTFNVKFKDGESHKKLICQCIGEPQTKYVWEKDHRKLIELPNLNLTSTVDQYGNGVLEFPSITKSHEGTYTCHAINEIGSDSYDFHVFLQDAVHPVPSSSGTSVKLISITCVFIALVICGFALLRYYKTKTMVRGNTDQELRNLT